MRACRVFGLAAALCVAGHVAWAQFDIDVEGNDDRPVTLIADSVSYDSENGTVIAAGNVEVYQGDRTLTADRIVYFEETERITATGALTLRDPTGTTVFGDAADLDAELRNGIVEGARLVIGTQGRLAAVEAERIEGRYNTLAKAVYSACDVCVDEPTPLWRIRADRVIHDEEEKLVHYESAYFDLFGVPVFWMPYFQHPDPTVKRATGFLAPLFLNDSNFGQALKIPFHIVLSDEADMTVTPFITTQGGQVAELEYRRAFETGSITLFGSIANSKIPEDEQSASDPEREQKLRGHFDGEGLFDLPRDFVWGFDITVASDDDYLDFYDFSNDDRLESDVFARRYQPDGFIDVAGVYFQSLRRRETSGNIPLVLPTVEVRQDLADPYLGGGFGLFSSTNVLLRDNGADTSRVTIGADWERHETLTNGLALRGFAAARVDSFFAQDSDTFEDATARLRPHAGIEMRYPLVLDVESAASHIFEPIAQGIVAPFGLNSDEIANEDSQIAELDETNIFDENHHAGLDVFEDGPRLNLGLRYSRVGHSADDPFTLDAVVGRVFRTRDNDGFSSGSGLAEAQSDIVAALTAGWRPYARLSSRVRLDDDLRFTRADVSGRFSIDPVDLGLTFSFFGPDPDIDLPIERKEISGNFQTALSENWSVGGGLSRDLVAQEGVDAVARVTFENECCVMRAFVRREFSEIDSEDEDTVFGIEIDFLTLGGDNSSSLFTLGGRSSTADFRNDSNN